MNVLFGTDLVLSLVLSIDYMDGLAVLFDWLRRIKANRCADISSVAIATRVKAPDKWGPLPDFTIIKTVVPKISRINALLSSRGHYTNIKPLLAQLSLLESGDVDFIVTENQQMIDCAKFLCLDDRVYSIEGFIEKCSFENRDIDPTKDYKVQRDTFDHLSIEDPFFDSFIDEYKPYYFEWFKKKQMLKDEVYVVRDGKQAIHALLKLKVENEKEDYSDIVPPFSPTKRLKISALKVEYTGLKLGERFLRIVFEKAISEDVDEIYVTIFNTSSGRKRLINLIEQWGFSFYGYKCTKELVYVRKMNQINSNDLRKTFPYYTITNLFIAPIHKIYARELLPSDSIDQVSYDIEPHKGAIRKVLVLHMDDLNLKYGSTLVFYQKGETSDDRRIIAIGVVENVYRNIVGKRQFLSRCRKLSILSDRQLGECWDLHQGGRPLVVVDFLYVYSFCNQEIIGEEIFHRVGINTHDFKSQHLYPLTLNQFKTLVHGTKYESRVIIDKA